MDIISNFSNMGTGLEIDSMIANSMQTLLNQNQSKAMIILE